MQSIIITCYNYARFLPAAVASVVAQTCPDWELIIVDDGSSDESPAVAQALAAHYAERRIMVLRQPNRGVAAARNAGAGHASGSYLLFLDADDLLAPTLLERSTTVLDQHRDFGFVYSGIRLFGQDNHVWPSRPFDRHALALDNFIPPSALVRRQAWQQIGGFDSAIINGWEDWDFWLRVSASWPGWYLAEPLLFYRRHGTSLSQRQASRSWDARAQIIRKHPDLYGPRLHAWATRRCAQRALPVSPQLNDTYPDALLVLPPIAVAPSPDAPSPDAPSPLVAQTQLSKTTSTISRCESPGSRAAKLQALPRRLLRRIPFSLRIRMRQALRKTQLGLCALGFVT